jgi:pimeloyl-ACP methyl ester carboxylesterase
MLSRTRRAALVAGLSLLALAPAANAATNPRFVRIAGFKSPGTPAKYNRVGILQTGKSSAKNVLVLNPGTSASAAYFEPVAKDIVKASPDWQVWAVERRENLLEDQSMLDKVKDGTATAKQAFDYYLGWLADSSISPHFQFIPDSTVGYAKQWGMNTEMEDLNRVVAQAKKLHGKVVVGGHSLGGSMTTAYATWDFKGKPGIDGISGLVFIDGGSGPTPESAAGAQAALDKLDDSKASPWLTFGGIAAPYTGLFNSTGALGAITDPNSPSTGQQFSLLPSNLKPPVPATNLGQYGYALDNDTSPASLAAAQGHIGHFATSGDPRGWVDDEITPIRRYAMMFGGWGLKGLDGTAWYHPMKLTIDSAVVAAGNKNAGQKILDVHATHGKDLPKTLRMYAFGAALGGTRVLDATKALAKQSGIPKKNLVLIDRHATYSHNDPAGASPKNDFVKNLIPFLKKIAK